MISNVIWILGNQMMKGRRQKLENISDLQYADRIEIFRQIGIDELNNVRLDIFDSIATSHYGEFLNFCNKVYEEKDRIKSVSCAFENDRLSFDIDYL